MRNVQFLKEGDKNLKWKRKSRTREKKILNKEKKIMDIKIDFPYGKKVFPEAKARKLGKNAINEEINGSGLPGYEFRNIGGKRTAKIIILIS